MVSEPNDVEACSSQCSRPNCKWTVINVPKSCLRHCTASPVTGKEKEKCTDRLKCANDVGIPGCCLPLYDVMRFQECQTNRGRLLSRVNSFFSSHFFFATDIKDVCRISIVCNSWTCKCSFTHTPKLNGRLCSSVFVVNADRRPVRVSVADTRRRDFIHYAKSVIFLSK